MRTRFLTLALFWATAATASAQFASGNLVVLQVGNGSSALTSAATPIQLDQFSTTGTGQTASATFAFPTTGVNQMTNSGTASSEGALTLSPSGQIVAAGYNAAAGTTGIASTTSATVPRVAYSVNVSSGTGIATQVFTTSTAFSANNIRSTYSNDTNAWAAGANTGVVLNTGTIISTTTTNLRVINSFNGNLYYSTGSGTAGIYQVGTGLPTAATTSALTITTGSSPYGFAINSASTIAYVADSTLGVQKYTYNGTAWSLAGTFSGSVSGTNGDVGLAVDFSGTNPILYATTYPAASGGVSSIISYTDSSTSSTEFTGAWTTLTTSPTNTSFRGIVLTTSTVPEPGASLALGAVGLFALRRFRR